jgi:hypothetical protein
MHTQHTFPKRIHPARCLKHLHQVLGLALLMPLWLGATPVLEQVAFTARLVAEAPASNTSRSDGTFDATLTPATGVLRWCVTHPGLPGGVSGYRLGTVGVNVANAVGPFSSPIVGSARLTPEQTASLLAGKWAVALSGPEGGYTGGVRTRP